MQTYGSPPFLDVTEPTHLRDDPIDTWDPQDQSLFQRISLATRSLDRNQLQLLNDEIEQTFDGFRTTLPCWRESLNAAIKNVEAYMEMVHTPKERLRMAEMAHELQLKDKEIKLKRLELELEQTRAERAEREQDKIRTHELSKRRLDSVDATIRAVILAQAELRDNPLAEELVGRFRGIYDTLEKMGYPVELDEESMMGMLERIGLQSFTQRTGIELE